MLAREVAGFHINRFIREGRPRDLRKRLRQINQRFCGCALDGGSISRMQISGLRLRIWPSVRGNFGHATSSLQLMRHGVRASSSIIQKAEKSAHCFWCTGEYAELKTNLCKEAKFLSRPIIEIPCAYRPTKVSFATSYRRTHVSCQFSHEHGEAKTQYGVDSEAI